MTDRFQNYKENFPFDTGFQVCNFQIHLQGS